MRITTRNKWILVTVLAITALIGKPVVAQNTPGNITIQTSGITYYAQAGDTLISIAKQLTTRSGNWIALGKRNRINKDSSIPIGTAIVIPADLLPDEPARASVIAQNGNISATAADGSVLALSLGSIVSEGVRISTGINSFLTLQLSDASRISLPSNSSVQLTKLRKTLYTGSPRTEVKLIQGKVVSRVSPLDSNKGRFEVRTPQSVAGVRGTYFRVSLNGTKVLNEVLEGHVMVGSTKAPQTLVLNPTTGNVIADNIVGEAVNLLPPPELNGAPYRADNSTSIQLALKPIDGARIYHIQISRDADLLSPLAETYSNRNKLHFDNLEDGDYFVRLSAIDNMGLEGIPSITAVRIKKSGSEESANPAQAAPSVVQSDDKSLILRWPGSVDQRYNIQISRDAEFSWLLFSSTVTGNEARFPRPSFGTYFTRVQSINADGSTNPFSFTQSLLVTDQWIINDGHPLRSKETSRNAAR